MSLSALLNCSAGCQAVAKGSHGARDVQESEQKAAAPRMRPRVSAEQRSGLAAVCVLYTRSCRSSA